jgi:ribose/xylose/arabinose/galactoside ABC-type transport system permease subunit
MTQRIKHILLQNGPLLTTITIFIMVFIMGGLLYPAMQKPQVFFNLFINTASLLIVSIGMTFVIITKGIDLSVAGMIALTSAASAALLAKGTTPVMVMPLMLLMGVAFGFTLGCVIHFLKVQPFIVTLMGLFFARGMAYIITLEALPIQDATYRFLALTKVHIPLFAKAYVYIPSLIGPLLLIIVI